MCIFKQKLGKDINVFSAGIHPMIGAGMDKRSLEWLEKNNYKIEVHQPKKITMELTKRCDLILALDHFILMHLNRMFPSLHKKIKLISYQFENDVNLKDPYRFDKDKYEKVMLDIEKVAENFSISNF